VILKVRFMKEAYMNTVCGAHKVHEPLIERDWPHHECRRAPTYPVVAYQANLYRPVDELLAEIRRRNEE
jgi:hypothetical protein